MRAIAILGVLLGVVMVSPQGVCFALPFNDDMLDSQLKTGQVMRAKPPDTVALGSLEYRINKKEDVENLQNPYGKDSASLRQGERLYAVNCLLCHGSIATKQYGGPGLVAGPGKFLIPPPDIASEAYKARTDGAFFGAIHFGGAGNGALMPALGFKLSAKEKWDIVTYIRKAQELRSGG